MVPLAPAKHIGKETVKETAKEEVKKVLEDNRDEIEKKKKGSGR